MYELPNLADDERVIPYGAVALYERLISSPGMLILTDRQLLFGRKRPEKDGLPGIAQFSVPILDIVELRRVERLRLVPALSVIFEVGQHVTFS